MRRTRGRGRRGRHHHHHAGEEEDSFTEKPLHPDHHSPSFPSASPSQGNPHQRPRWRNESQQQHSKFRFVKKSDSELGHDLHQQVASLSISEEELDAPAPENHQIGNKDGSELNTNGLSHVIDHVASSNEGDNLGVDITPLPLTNHQNENKEGSELNINGVSDDTEHVVSSSEVNEADDIMGRLDKLLSDMEEPELSEEQLRVNDQSQEDELLVMESIYGENISNLERWKGLRCFQIHIHVEVLGETAITAKLNSSTEFDAVSNKSDDFLYSFKVQYLPPIVLTCLLPKSYPSHQPPIFTISVQWLEPINIFSLCSKLDSIWAEQRGQEVIYQWVEWLHSSSLSHLGIDQEITLGPYRMNCVGDERVVSGTVSNEVHIPLLRSYNNEKHHENFLKELHECCICYSEYAGTEFARLPCQHFFCWKCFQTFTHLHVKEGNISNLRCPDSKCTVMIPPALLKRLLSDEEYERWESLMLEKTLASMSDVAYCPRCETPCIEDEDQHAQCSKCFFSFCTLCKERRHVGVACMTLDMKLQILQERQNSSRLKDDQILSEREKINELLSMKEIKRDSKQCPFCQIAISRTEGCNKMKCSNCYQYFCYRCNKALDESDPYGHFRDGSCELFPQEMIETWQERINPRQAVAQLQAELFPRRGLSCPNCRQFNAKVGNNNHMFCWACQSHYCYLCKEIVRRSAQHYGPKGCKQHTEG